ncbi:hypothetical protein [Bartonella rattimassiliensis]|uniref:Uncharacterized protein n=1 Tax=Bartonella rattimassiliensis 15908 TaxID=1094556 RepID=J1JEY1_9HYPH|nr:hypothetical protein [Bartonella rattimassiliensis]EJF82650.1 hypothetical protein MCY_01707 [Bartonella rattimassiliensis 15908]
MKKLILVSMAILTIGLSLTGCGKSEEEKRRAQQEEQTKKFFGTKSPDTDRGHEF